MIVGLTHYNILDIMDHLAGFCCITFAFFRDFWIYLTKQTKNHPCEPQNSEQKKGQQQLELCTALSASSLAASSDWSSPTVLSRSVVSARPRSTTGHPATPQSLRQPPAASPATRTGETQTSWQKVPKVYLLTS